MQAHHREVTEVIQSSMSKITNDAIAQVESVMNNVKTFISTRFLKKPTPTTESQVKYPEGL